MEKLINIHEVRTRAQRLDALIVPRDRGLHGYVVDVLPA